MIIEFDRSKHKQEDLDKWAGALRSGAYTQHHGEMCDPDEPNSACCLHVAGMAVDGTSWEEPLIIGGDTVSIRSKSFPSAVNRFAFEMSDVRIDGIQGSLPSESRLLFPYLNDTLKVSFEDIATLIETGTLDTSTLGKNND